jgi:hypothetical protein
VISPGDSPWRSSPHLRLRPRRRVRHVHPVPVDVAGNDPAGLVMRGRPALLTAELPRPADSPILERLAAGFTLRPGVHLVCCLFGHFSSHATSAGQGGLLLFLDRWWPPSPLAGRGRVSVVDWSLERLSAGRTWAADIGVFRAADRRRRSLSAKTSKEVELWLQPTK